jgi:DNA polymerase-3 subunit alpha
MAPAPSFSHLHVHSEYSILDGANKVGPMIERACECGMKHVGLTDHGTMAGTVDLYKKATKAGIHPVLGMEAYLTQDQSIRALEDGKRSETTHLTLLAADNGGWQNLMSLSSDAFVNGMYYKPRTDYAQLEQKAKGLIALTGCMASKTQQFILAGDDKAAHGEVARLRDIFGADNLYVEIQDNGVVDERSGLSQQAINTKLRAIGEDLGLPFVITSDVHYLLQSHAKPHDALLCIQTKARLADEKRFKFSTDQFWFKTQEEMFRQFEPLGYPLEWFTNTEEIAERCQVKLTLGENLLPPFDCPEGHTSDSYLRELCEAGLRIRYGDSPSKEIRDRLDFELSTIARMGYSAYFLITWDWIRWARDHDIPIGPGRGSAAGSIVAYTTWITDLDPMKYDLLFERFLNPDRISMPDIDTDVAQEGREACIRYLTQKYGSDRVAQISTFGRLQPKAAVKDAARVMDYPVAIGEMISKLIPDGPGQSFKKNMAEGMDLAKAYAADPTVKAVVDMAMPLEGMVRNTGIHAAAVVISDRPLADIVPVRTGEHGDQVVTQFEQADVEDLGLLKMDVLGLRNLDVLKKVKQFVHDSKGLELDIGQIPLDDVETFEMIARGDTTGVFQLESEGMQGAARQVKPTRFEDIIALVALYRPGPMEYIPTFAANKRNPDSIVYEDERLESILADTYGITCYQEQYMLIARKLANFTPGQADELRKGIAKKLRPVLDKVKPMFLDGCAKNGVAKSVAAGLWEDAEKAGDYSFNKSHAACYGLIAYQTAWLKCHHPSEYMAALISTVMHTKDKVPFFVAASKKMGINVLPPDVNESVHDFRVLPDGAVRFGLSAVKGVGHAAIDEILKARAEKPFESLYDFCQRVSKEHANKRVVEALVKAGAFDCTGDTRKGQYDAIPSAMQLGAKTQADAASGQYDLFGDLLANGEGAEDGDENSVQMEFPPISNQEWLFLEKLDFEREATGLYMSGHPIDEWRDAIDARTVDSIGDVNAFGAEINRRIDEEGYVPPKEERGRGGERDDKRHKVKVGGIVQEYRALVTKKGQPMAFFVLEGTDGQTVRVVVFPAVFEQVREKLQGDRRVIILDARLEAKEGSVDLMAERVCTLHEAPELNAVTVRAPSATFADEHTMSELRRILKNYPGQAEVTFRVQTPQGEQLMRLGEGWRVKIEPGLRQELRELLGDEALV